MTKARDLSSYKAMSLPLAHGVYFVGIQAGDMTIHYKIAVSR